MSTITFIPKIPKTQLQSLAKSRKQALTDLINEALEQYIEEQNKVAISEQVEKAKKLQAKFDQIIGNVTIPKELKNKDIDDILNSEFDEQISRFKN